MSQTSNNNTRDQFDAILRNLGEAEEHLTDANIALTLAGARCYNGGLETSSLSKCKRAAYAKMANAEKALMAFIRDAKRLRDALGEKGGAA